MTVSYIMNVIDRFGITPKVTAGNRQSAGHPIRQTIITDNGSTDMRIKRWALTFANKFIDNGENIGNAQALNNAMKVATGDIIVIAGNDIKLPRPWLSEAIKLLQNKDVGLVGFGNVEGKEETINEQDCITHPHGTVGVCVFRRSLLDRVGYFATFSKYGYWDGDFSARVRMSGLKDVYLKNIQPDHIGEDHGEDTAYRKMKDVEAKKAWPKIKELRGKYRPTAYYLTEDNKVMNTSGEEETRKPKKRRKRTTKK